MSSVSGDPSATLNMAFTVGAPSSGSGSVGQLSWKWPIWPHPCLPVASVRLGGAIVGGGGTYLDSLR
eukprot:scaffold6629_cov103-Cylindrotheca_fusiformis.AAC.2